MKMLRRRWRRILSKNQVVVFNIFMCMQALDASWMTSKMKKEYLNKDLASFIHRSHPPLVYTFLITTEFSFIAMQFFILEKFSIENLIPEKEKCLSTTQPTSVVFPSFSYTQNEQRFNDYELPQISTNASCI